MVLETIPILSVLLIGFATFLILSGRKKRKDSLPLLFLILNGVLLVAMLTFFVNYLWNTNIFSNTPAWFFWSLIILGLVIEIFCLYKKYVPGQIIASATHLFVVFATIFSIGIILLLLAVIELIIAIINLKKRNYGLAS